MATMLGVDQGTPMRFLAYLAVAAVLLGGEVGPALGDSRSEMRAAQQRGDYATVARLLRPEAQDGDTVAQVLLGSLYEQGKGVPRDLKQAVHWYRKAADQGDAEGQALLALMYLEGKGVPKDHFHAYVLLNKAATASESAAQMRNLVEKMLTPEQIAKAKRVATEISKEDAEQIFKRGLDMINSCVKDFLMIELGKATPSKQFEALIQDRCGPQQRYVVMVMTQKPGGKPGEPAQVANMRKSIDGMRQQIVVKYAQMRRTLHPKLSKDVPCHLSEYLCAIQND